MVHIISDQKDSNIKWIIYIWIQTLCHSNSEYSKLDIFYGYSMKIYISDTSHYLCPLQVWEKNNYICICILIYPFTSLGGFGTSDPHSLTCRHGTGWLPSPCSSFRSVKMSLEIRVLTMTVRNLLDFGTFWKADAGEPPVALQGCSHACVCIESLHCDFWQNKYRTCK